jgi:hypothetical protein
MLSLVHVDIAIWMLPAPVSLLRAQALSIMMNIFYIIR